MPDGKPHHRAQDLTGRVFGFLTIKSYAGSDGKKSLWNASCACGAAITVVGAEMTKKRGPGNQSCGCQRGALIGAKRRTHGMTEHPAYWVWRSMHDRCRLPTHQAWRNYGGRGITVTMEWETFQAFWRDMGPTYRPGLTLERVDNSKGYSAENCRWASYKEQARNTRENRMVDTPKGRMLVVEASEVSGIGVTTLLYRLDNDCPTARLFDPPDYTNRFST